MKVGHLVGGSLVLCVGFAGYSVVDADTSDVVINSQDVQLSEVDSGGWSATVIFTNLTSSSLKVSGGVPAEPECRVTIDKDSLRPRQSTEVKLTIPRGCTVESTGVTLELLVDGGAVPMDPFVVNAAAPAARSEAHWNWLWLFPAALAAALSVAAVLRFIGKSKIVPTDDRYLARLDEATQRALGRLPSEREDTVRYAVEAAALDSDVIVLPERVIRRSVSVAIGERFRDPTYVQDEASLQQEMERIVEGLLDDPVTSAIDGAAIAHILPGPSVSKVRWPWSEPAKLEHLDAKWSFKDGWVSNITVLGGLLTGLLGSSATVKAIIGDDADDAVALALVGVAIAAALVAAAPILLEITKADRVYTVGGLLLAACVTTAAATGQIWVTAATGRALDIETGVVGWDLLVNVAALIATVILLVYSWRTSSSYIVQGQTAPREELPGPEIIAATIADWSARDGRPIDQSLLTEVVEHYQSGYPRPWPYPGVSF